MLSYTLEQHQSSDSETSISTEAPLQTVAPDFDQLQRGMSVPTLRTSACSILLRSDKRGKWLSWWIPGFPASKVPIVAKAMVFFSYFPCLPSDGHLREIQADSYRCQTLEDGFTNSATLRTRQEMEKNEDGKMWVEWGVVGCTGGLRPHLLTQAQRLLLRLRV